MNIKNDWKLVKIKHIGVVKTGRTPPTKNVENFGSEYLFITPSDMDGRKKIDCTERKLSGKGAKILSSCKVSKNSVCVSCIGWQMGKVVMTTQACFTNQQINTIIPKREVIFPDYLYYSLATRREEFNNLGSVGTRTPILKKSLFEEVKLHLPPLPTQRKIAAILSAYDDLIENNNRRIEILEEMARMLYREWFVKFRYPGHESDRFYESELGLIPQGWEVKSFGKVSLNLDKKRKPLSSLIRAKMPGKYPYYGAAKVFDYINDYIFDGRYLLIAEDGSVITKDRTPVLQIADGQFWVNNHAHIIQGKPPISTNFLYLFMSFFDISGYITGSAQPKINQTNLNRISVLVPSRELLKCFDEMVNPIFTKIELLNKKNNNLRQTRALLLPRLISGEIDVENLDIKVIDN